MKTCSNCAEIAMYTCVKCNLQLYCSKYCADQQWMCHNQEHEAEPPTEIVKNFWIGGISGLIDKKFMKNVNVVISLLGEKKYPQHRLEMMIEKYDLDHLRISIEDEPDAPIECYFESVALKIDQSLKSGKIVFLHCGMGVSRAVTMAVYYLAKYDKFKYMACALMHIMELRRTARPIPEFLIKLRQCE